MFLIERKSIYIFLKEWFLTSFSCNLVVFEHFKVCRDITTNDLNCINDGGGNKYV